MLAIDDLITATTEEHIFELFLSILETLGINARAWRIGGVSRTILRVVAKTLAGFFAILTLAIRSTFLETSEGGWLTLLAYYVYGVTRVEATFATGKVELHNTGGGIFTLDAEECRFLWTAEGKAYTNVAGFTLNPGDTLLVDVRAVELGASSSAPPGAINTLESVLAGVEVTNPESVVGLDAESDEDVRTACRNKLASFSVRGPRGAYAEAVRIVKRIDGSPVNINRSSISPSSSTGVVTIYVAAPSGAPDPDDLTAIENSVEEHARPDSVTAVVLAATEVPVTRTLTVWAKKTNGLVATDLAASVSAALVNEVAIYPIGGIPKPPSSQGYLYADFLAGVAKGVHASIFDVDGAGADVALSPGEVASLATTVNVRFVSVS